MGARWSTNLHGIWTSQGCTGNVVSTPPSIVSTANYSGSGIAIKMLGDANYTAEPTEIISVEFEASSEFGVSEIEIFIDNEPVKFVKTKVRHYFRFHWIFLNLV